MQKCQKRIKELEAYCDELFEKLNKWNEMDQKSQLIVNSIDAAVSPREKLPIVSSLKAQKENEKPKKPSLLKAKKNNFSMTQAI